MRLGHDVMQRRHPRAWQLSVPRSQVAGVYPEYLPSPSHPSVTLAEQAFHRVRALRVGDRTGLVDNLMAQGKAGRESWKSSAKVSPERGPSTFPSPTPWLVASRWLQGSW